MVLCGQAVCVCVHTLINTHSATHNYTFPATIAANPIAPAVKISPPSNPCRSAHSSVAAGSLEKTCRLQVDAQQRCECSFTNCLVESTYHLRPRRDIKWTCSSYSLSEEYEALKAVKILKTLVWLPFSSAVWSTLRLTRQLLVQKLKTGTVSSFLSVLF